MSTQVDLARIPALPRGVRLHHDRVRGMEVLLGPERTLMLDGIGHAILSELDGQRSTGAIAADLAARFGAPPEQVTGDVVAFLQDLADKRLVDMHDG
ncbi:pyrroloquinoline quinone biosynthesis peptide chaperone PqqD [Meridianimarinicoccus roseus]|uniref:Pyrroloquinoline quinone biosynthesis peptide chaperone PqqD n=1 Tax=Meridianimarinicoccus roseus TaxID=2072018 RepID=A0A2V2LCH4_9RHOB|nr:pyrroloquinoline quinone biosynthesis peptide chaperone PqqD [Meridianimarinicoccus roseus]PWR00956.1 pyrroloquinoline quinone biosynthesis peptide chaperone PqqD [Meridianimarinicoccus roseus]